MDEILFILQRNDQDLDFICETNDPEKQFILAKRYIEGLDGYPQDKEKGMKYLRRSVKSLNSNALLYYSIIILKEQNYEKTIQDVQQMYQFLYGFNSQLYYFSQSQIMINYKEYAKALDFLEKAASLGHLQSMYQLATFYDIGTLGVIDKEKSVSYYKKAAELEHLESMYRYAYMLEKGLDVQVDKEKSLYFYKKAADKGHINSIFKYASKLARGDGTQVELKEAYRYFILGKREQEKVAQFQCGWMLQNGYCVEKNLNESKRFYEMINDSNNEEIEIPNESDSKLRELCENFESLFVETKKKAMAKFVISLTKYDHYYGMLKEKMAFFNKISADKGLFISNDSLMKAKYGNLIPVDDENARIYYQIAIDQCQNKNSDEYYKAILGNGYGLPIDIRELNDYFKEEADKGDEDAISLYAQILKEEIYIPINSNESKHHYYKLAADHGNEEIAYLYANIVENESNDNESIHYYKIAADKGHIESMFKYGLMVQKGRGVTIDKKEAAVYFKKAADKGNVSAMNNYAIMLHDGDGIEANKEEACRYFKQSADGGNADAMNNYGIVLNHGYGVPIDKNEATRYFKMAAEKEHPDGMNNYAHSLYKISAEKGHVGAMIAYAERLQKGEGVEKSKFKALKYYKLASQKGDQNEMKIYRKYVKSLFFDFIITILKFVLLLILIFPFDLFH